MEQEATTRARLIFEAVRDFSFSEYPAMDLEERLGLLTVPALIRPVAVLGVGEPKQYETSLVRLRDILGNFGLRSLFSKPIPATYEGSALPNKVNEIFRDWDSRNDAKHSALLWLYQAPEIRGALRAIEQGAREAGILLGYPECCVAEDKARKLRAHDAFARAIIHKVGDSSDAIRKALDSDLGVEVDDAIFDTTNVKRTAQQFPFVLHIACENCLKISGSPTAVLNNKYGNLAKAIHPEFFGAIIEAKTK